MFMAGKQKKHNHPKPFKQLVPSLLNRRRLVLKKILNRYMGLNFTQLQPGLQPMDLAEAGLLDTYQEMVEKLLPRQLPDKLEMEPVAIEVRGVAVAFDEEISFTHYRYQTLQSSLYKLPFLQDLTRYHTYCLHWGEIIGEEESPAIARILRQRALQDFLQDMLPVAQHLPIFRLSVYDQFSNGHKTCSLHEILAEEDEPFYLHVADYIADELERIDANFYPIP